MSYLNPQLLFHLSSHLLESMPPTSTSSFIPTQSLRFFRTRNYKPKHFFFSSKTPTSYMCECSVTSVMSNSLWPYGLSPPGSSVHGILQERILEWVAISSSRGFSKPGNKPVSPALADGFFTIWATWKVHWTLFKSNIPESLSGCRMVLGMDCSPLESCNRQEHIHNSSS